MTETIALIYDEITPGGNGSWVEAEYESPESIDALLAAIGEHCDEAVAIPFDSQLLERLAFHAPDLVFNIAEGRGGPSRESIVPSVMELLAVPYTGSDGVSLGISLNKAVTKQLAAHAGIRTPRSWLFHSSRQAAERCGSVEFPVLVKPNFGGASVGISPGNIVQGPARLPSVVGECVARYDQPCLVEQYVTGEDVTIGLLGNDPVEILPPGAIRTPDGLYSAEAKRNHDRECICPCPLPDDLHEQLAAWSLAIHRLIGARDFSRVDYIIDREGRAFFLEINPLPGLSPYYGIMPVLAAAAGYTYTGLIGAIIAASLERQLTERSSRRERLGAGAAKQYHIG